MGIIMSRFHELDSIQFVKFPTKPRAGLRVVRVNGSLFASGKVPSVVYTTIECLTRRAAYMARDWWFLDTVLEALVLLSVIPQHVRDEHTAMVRANAESDEARDLLEHTVPRFEKLGLKLTTIQLEKLRALADMSKAKVRK